MKAGRSHALVPALGWLREYRAGWFRLDFVAGLTTAAVVIPKCLAYSTIAGLPLALGVYTAIIPMLAYVALGTSRPLSVSTTTTIAILTAGALAAAVPDGSPDDLAAAAATLAVLVGAVLVAGRILRLGFVGNFISEPVLTGFKAGIGLVITVDQLPKLFGVHIHKAGFVRNIASIVREIPETSVPTLLLAMATLALLAVLPLVLPKAPSPLIAVAGGIAASALLGLGAGGVETVGNVPLGLPAPAMPVLALAGQLWAPAVGIALMSFVETVAAGRAFASRDEPRPNANAELLAVGVGNALGGLFGAMPAGGGTSQTAVNRKAGARTQVSEIVTAAAAIATLLFLAPVIGYMPQATLAAVVIATSLPLIDPKSFRDILAIRRTEFIWALTATAGVMLLGTLQGILVAVIVSLLALAKSAQDPPVYLLGRKKGTNVFRPLTAEHPDDETLPGVVLARVEGRVFFLNAQRIGDKLVALLVKHSPTVLVIDCSAIIDLEYTALKALTEAEERLRAEGTLVCLAALNPEARRVVERSPLGKILGRERMFFNLEHAAEAAPALAAR
jgi:high affinity sulfate transporter 1